MATHFHPPRAPRQKDVLHLSDSHVRYLAISVVKRSEEKVLGEHTMSTGCGPAVRFSLWCPDGF